MIIKRKSIGEIVLKWQEFLMSKDYSIGALDGIFGQKTEDATKDWQAKSGLKVDGAVGDKSFTKASAEGFKYDKSVMWYPPKPSFGSPSLAAVKQMFGEFQYNRLANGDINILGNWVADNIVKVEIKQLKGVLGAPSDGKIHFHKKGVEQLRGFFDEAEKQNLANLIISWAGSFYPRMVRGSKTSLSNHSWGSAFDINAPENWLNTKPAPVAKKGSLLKLVPIANSYGFFWGGHYTNRLDGMHFELSVLDKFPG